MSRQRKSRGFPVWMLILVVALVTVAGYAAFRHGDGTSSLRTIEELDPELYYANANSLRGNTYRIDAEIDSSLGNSPTKGRLFSVRLRGGSGKIILPVLVPVGLSSLTIQKRQHYLMKVKVADGGFLLVEEARKP
jgi:hypothetical protein